MFSLEKVNIFKTLALVLSLLAPLGQGNMENFEQLQKIETCMDHSVDPCEDFNAYACGNWPKIHASDPFDDIEGYLEYTHFSRMLNLIQEHYPLGQEPQQDEQNFQDKAAIYLKSCLLVKRVEILKYLDEIKPGLGLEWPLLDELQANRTTVRLVQQKPWSTFDAFELLGQLNSYGFTNDLIKHRSQRINGQIITTLTIPDETEFEVETARLILQEMKLTPENINQQMEELLKTHSYWQASYKEYAEFGENENIFSYEDIKRTNPPLDRFLQHIIPQHLRDEEGFVALPYWDYMQSLTTRQWPANENQKFSNYIMIRFLSYLKEINAAGCLATGQERMHLAFDYLYYKHDYLPQGREINQDITDITKKIHKHFLSIIYENHLNLSRLQIQGIKQVLGDLTINIGNLPEKVDEAMVEKFYSHLPAMNIRNFYANDLIMLKHRILEPLMCLPNMVCEQPTVELFPIKIYNYNTVIISFKDLNSPVYQSNLDALLGLSNFGYVLAHEFAHAIEPEIQSLSSMYDISLENTIQQPHIRAALQCMQHQERTDFPTLRIADLMAARVAFRAYAREHNVQPNFTNIPWRQLFFLNLGQLFCAKADPLDVSGSNGARLNHIARNMEIFARAFKCPVGSKMNPAKKCRFY